MVAVTGLTLEKDGLLPTKEGYPVTQFFRTREAAVGILQITGISDNPRGVKIRYKLVQAADPVRKTGDTSDHANAPVAISAQGGKVVLDASGSRIVADRIEIGQADAKPAAPADREAATRAALAKKAAKPKLVFRGLDLSSAPVVTKLSDIPDLWDAGSEQLRKGVEQTRSIIAPNENLFLGHHAQVYYCPDKKVFYVMLDDTPAGSSGSPDQKYYGPFSGDPHQTLDLKPPLPEPATGSARPKLAFRDLDLTDAPVTTDISKLPDVWNTTAPRGFRASVTYSPHLLEQGYSVWIVYVADKDVFYLKLDSVWSRTEHFYGPFKGDPFKRFGLEAFPSAAGVRARAGRPAEVPWGEAVEGVQARLRADKTVWKAGEVPAFKADVRNIGNRQLGLAPAQQVCELELDGVEFSWAGEVSVISGVFPPGAKFDGIEISLGQFWASKKGGLPLKLTVGKHRLRVTFFVTTPPGVPYKVIASVVSNPVDFTIEKGSATSVKRRLSLQ